jgi:hypothetical protein
MRTVPVVAAAVIVGAAIVSGCGQVHGGVVAPPPPSATSSGGSSGSSGPLSGASGSGGGQVAACHGTGSLPRARSLTITAADNGKRYCVPRGTSLAVFLKGTPSRKWAPIQASSDVLKPSANGELALALGVTGASFLAARTGTAVIHSAQPVCAAGVPPRKTTPGAGTAGSGSMSCTAMLAFRVTVTVTA